MSHYFEPVTAKTVLGVFSVKDYGAKGDNVADDSAAILRAINAMSGAAPARGGILFFPPGTYKTTQAMLFDSGRHYLGSGETTTIINYSGTGYAADYAASGGNTDFSLQDMTINTTAASLGAVRIGLLADANPVNPKNRVVLRNLVLAGAGESNVGTFGMNLSGLSISRLDNIDIAGFETAILMDRTTANLLTRLYINSFRWGITWQVNGAGGGSADQLVGAQIAGSTIGTNGYCIKFDYGTVMLAECYFEPQPPVGVTMPEVLLFTSNSGGCKLVNCHFDFGGAGTRTNFFVFAAAASRVTFIGVSGGAGMEASTVGLPALGNTHMFIGVDQYIAGSFAAVNSTYVTVITDAASRLPGTLSSTQQIYGGSGVTANTAQTAAGVLGGTGVPTNAVGNNGDIYIRSDGGAGTTIYQRRAGAWVATGA